jgi:hypothetical protein
MAVALDPNVAVLTLTVVDHAANDQGRSKPYLMDYTFDLQQTGYPCQVQTVCSLENAGVQLERHVNAILGSTKEH